MKAPPIPSLPVLVGIFLFSLILNFFQLSIAKAEPLAPEGMLYIPEGYFPMGDSDSKFADESPQHFVYTSPYFIDKYEVSNAQYRSFIEATGHPEPEFWEDERFNQQDHPVVGVSWYDAMAYARWKSRRLPTEAEWEKAARGRDARPYPWGDKLSKGALFYFVNIFGVADNYEFTAPTTYYETGRSPFGVYNLAGNVWEWCLDWYEKDYYKKSPEIDPKGPTDSTGMKVLRGGSWANDIENVTTSKRARNYPHQKNNMYGFRTVQPVR